MPVDHLKTCGQFGYVGKNGKPCGYRIGDGETACFHHTEDKTKQKRVMEALHVGVRTMRQESLAKIETNDFRTIEDCLKVRAQVVDVLKRERSPDYRKLDMILKATSGASTDHATKAAKEQNEILLMLDGHGAGVAALNRLRESSVRVLPGRKTLSVRNAQEAVAAEGPVIDIEKKEPA